LAKIEEEIEKSIEKKIESLGYQLYDIEYIKEGKNYILRIYIDKAEGININDCEAVSIGISDFLDTLSILKDQYILEVSSPGIERTLRKDKHLEKNIGSEIQIKLFKKDENNCKEYRGILKEFDDECISIEIPEEKKIDRKNIAHIKTIYNW